MAGKKGFGGKKGRSGRRPLPAAVKKAKGTYRPSREKKRNPNEVPVTLGRPDMPKRVAKDKEAAEEWTRIANMLEKARALSDADKAMLAEYVMSYSLAVRATEKYQREDIVVATPTGQMKANPAIAIAQKASAAALRLAIEFGLTPAARSRVSAVPDKEGDEAKDDDEKFLFEGPPRLVVSNG